jgi:hypothetical protein
VDRFSLAIGTNILPDRHLHLTLAERDQLIVALSTYAQELYTLLHRDNLFLNEAQGIVGGIHDEQSMRTWLGTHRLLTDNYRN